MLSPARLLFALPLIIWLLSEGPAPTSALILSVVIMSLRARAWERTGYWAGRFVRTTLQESMRFTGRRVS